MTVHTGEIVDRDAIEIGELYGQAKQSIIDSVHYQIECGKRLADKKASMAHGEWLPWLDINAGVLGFSSRRTATMLMKAAATSNGKPASHLDEEGALAISRKTWGHHKNFALIHTGDPESYTPAEHVEAARATMGGIDLDPASNEIAQETVRAAKWFGVEDDGLAHEWHGRVFLNPPYAYPAGSDFVHKLCEGVSAGNVTQAVLLTNNNTDTKWWQLAAGLARVVCFTLGRINFYQADGEITQPTNGQSFFYFGGDIDAFRRNFKSVGLIMEWC